jgi:drug/metabolite transporter (DMT)-like permease
VPRHTSTTQPVWAIAVAMGLVYVVWGSTYLGIRVTVETMPAFMSAGVRFLLAGLLTLAVLALRHRGRLQLPPRRQVIAAAAVGIVLLVGGPGLISFAETRVPSNLAAVIASTASIWVVVYRLAARARLTRVAAAGVVVGFGGVAVLLLPGADAAGVAAGWLLLCLLSAFFWSSGSYYGRRLQLPADPFMTAVIEMVVGGVALILLGAAVGEVGDVDLGGVSARSGAALAYLVIAGAIAFSAYVWLLQHVPISTVVTHQYVNPVVAVALGWALLDESLPLSALIGAALVVAAVVTIVRQESRDQPPDG